MVLRYRLHVAGFPECRNHGWISVNRNWNKRNRERDVKAHRALGREGWKVLAIWTIWYCAMKAAGLADIIRGFLEAD